MKITIKAKVGYKVRRLNKIDEVGLLLGYDKPCMLIDGNDPVMIAGLRDEKDYRDEVVFCGNEAARKCEIFKTEKGNIFVYWRDEEADKDFITKLNGGE